MSSVASSVKIAATSGSKSTGLIGGRLRRRPAGAAPPAALRGLRGCAAAMRCSRASLRALDALEQLPVIDEVAGGLIEMRRDRLHRRPCSPRAASRSSLRQSEAAAEGAAQPVIERLGEADAVARLRHLRAARERVAGAVDLLGQRVRLGELRLARQIRAHGGHVGGGLARVDVAQRVIRDLRLGAARLAGGCGRWRPARLDAAGAAAAAGGDGVPGAAAAWRVPVAPGAGGCLGRRHRAARARARRRAAGRERVGARGDRHEVRASPARRLELLDELRERCRPRRAGSRGWPASG